MSSLIILTVISLNFSSALEITLQFPSSIRVNEEFDVFLEADSSETHDVKIFVHNSEDEKITRGEYVSEIENDGWQDSWNYVPSIFPEKKEFSIKITEFSEKLGICARLRKSDTQTTSIKCYELENVEEAEDEETQVEEPEDEEESEEKEEAEEKIEEESPKVKNPIVEISQTKKSSPEEKEKIVLNSAKPVEKIEFIETKKEKTRKIITYSFSAILVLIVVLFGLKKL